MLERAVLPDLRARGGEPAVIASRVLHTWGESESGLNERLDGVIAALDDAGDPTIAFLARGWNGLEVRLTTAPARRPTPRRPCSTEWEAELRERARPARVRRRRRVDGVRRARPAAVAGADARPRRVAHRRARRRPADGDPRRQRRVPRRRRVLRQRGQVRAARRVAGSGGQRAGGRARWPRACSGCSAPTSASASPASPARPSRTTCPSAPCASASPCRPARTPRRCGSAPQREQIRQFAVISSARPAPPPPAMLVAT